MNKREYDIIRDEYINAENMVKNTLANNEYEYKFAAGYFEGVKSICSLLGIMVNNEMTDFRKKTLVEQVCDVVLENGYKVGKIKSDKRKQTHIIEVLLHTGETFDLDVSDRIIPSEAESYIMQLLKTINTANKLSEHNGL